jgi:hypothetical protein
MGDFEPSVMIRCNSIEPALCPGMAWSAGMAAGCIAALSVSWTVFASSAQAPTARANPAPKNIGSAKATGFFIFIEQLLMDPLAGCRAVLRHRTVRMVGP